MQKLKKLWRDYWDCYYICAEWLASWFPPFRWHFELWKTLRDMRLEVLEAIGEGQR